MDTNDTTTPTPAPAPKHFATLTVAYEGNGWEAQELQRTEVNPDDGSFDDRWHLSVRGSEATMLCHAFFLKLAHKSLNDDPSDTDGEEVRKTGEAMVVHRLVRVYADGTEAVVREVSAKSVQYQSMPLHEVMHTMATRHAIARSMHDAAGLEVKMFSDILSGFSKEQS